MRTALMAKTVLNILVNILATKTFCASQKMAFQQASKIISVLLFCSPMEQFSFTSLQNSSNVGAFLTLSGDYSIKQNKRILYKLTTISILLKTQKTWWFKENMSHLGKQRRGIPSHTLSDRNIFLPLQGVSCCVQQVNNCFLPHNY